MESSGIDDGVDGDGGDVECATCANDAQRDLTTIGDEDFAEQSAGLLGSARSERSQLSASEQLRTEFDGLTIRDETFFDDGVELSFNLVHELHGFDDAEGLS